ncbi:hypothetical protein TNCV_4798741 [Trichonephila clavipes]|nr:hypothetical protein TNCV_4798741 [Trichonephila clavipes]
MAPVRNLVFLSELEIRALKSTDRKGVNRKAVITHRKSNFKGFLQYILVQADPTTSCINTRTSDTKQDMGRTGSCLEEPMVLGKVSEGTRYEKFVFPMKNDMDLEECKGVLFEKLK